VVLDGPAAQLKQDVAWVRQLDHADGVSPVALARHDRYE